MKILFTILIMSLTLNAWLFDLPQEQINTKNIIKDNIQDKFRKIVKNANAIIKKGEYEKYINYKNTFASINKEIELLDMSKDEKEVLKKELTEYKTTVDLVYKNLKNKASKLNMHYLKTLNGLSSFNQSVASTGYGPLLKEWYVLTKIKRKFMRKPNAKLAKEFNQKFELVKMIIIELYLDEELEDPLLSYLDNYKKYFQGVNQAYKNVEYKNVQNIKLLSYKIKSILEFT